MVVCKSYLMPTHAPSLTFLCLFLLHCGGPATSLPLSDLDYAEVTNATGWKLRLYGDGSGSLSHEQLPAYHLHYPSATFDARPARKLTRHCRGEKITDLCAVVRFYSAPDDRLVECRCVSSDWPTSVLQQAVVEMHDAVEAGGSERSCRMLLRQWLATR